MKKLKLIMLALAAILFLGVGSVSAQENNQQILIIRTIESSKAGAITPKMIVVTPTGEKQITPLFIHKWTDYDEQIGENTVIVQKEIIKWQKQGFKVTNSSTDGGDVYQRTFIIMIKE